ncbi:MAG: leucine-rich repeat protein, partial [Oscillospiraceae bacterium]|nr:leucine-rich repeat protein [Oscillospiraceae bacterium]
VITIRNDIFDECNSLQEINVDSNNTKYESENGILYDKNKITLIQYPVGNSNTTYTLPASTTTIKEKAFKNCLHLQSILVSEGNSAFISKDGVLFDKNIQILYVYPGNRANKRYYIPEGVKETKKWSFYNSKQIEEVIIPKHTRKKKLAF